MTREEHRQALEMWIGSKGVGKAFGKAFGEAKDLNEALYAISELRLWPDGVDSVSPEQAMTCWQLIERLRTERLPDYLRM